ncbi:MAG: hypothetical protein V4613_00215 [Bacteroidota bacterium]
MKKHSLCWAFYPYNEGEKIAIFNYRVFFILYFNPIALEFDIYNIKKVKWSYRFWNYYTTQNQDISLKDTILNIVGELPKDEILNRESNELLHLYLHLLDNNMGKLIKGDYNEIEHEMEWMIQSQIDEIRKFLAEQERLGNIR